MLLQGTGVLPSRGAAGPSPLCPVPRTGASAGPGTSLRGWDRISHTVEATLCGLWSAVGGELTRRKNRLAHLSLSTFPPNCPAPGSGSSPEDAPHFTDT